MFVKVDELGAGGNSFHPHVSQGNALDTTHFVFAEHRGAQGARARAASPLQSEGNGFNLFAPRSRHLDDDVENGAAAPTHR